MAPRRLARETVDDDGNRMRIFGGCVHTTSAEKMAFDAREMWRFRGRIVECWWFGVHATVAVDNVSRLPGDLNSRKPAALVTEAASKHGIEVDAANQDCCRNVRRGNTR